MKGFSIWEDRIIIDREGFERIRRIVGRCNSAEAFILKIKSLYIPIDEKHIDGFYEDFKILKQFFKGRSTNYDCFRNNIVDQLKVIGDPFILDSTKIQNATATIGPMEPIGFKDIYNVYEQYLINRKWLVVSELPARLIPKLRSIIPSGDVWMKFYACCIDAPNYTCKELEEKPILNHIGEEICTRMFPKRIGTKKLPTGRYAAIIEVGGIKNMYIF